MGIKVSVIVPNYNHSKYLDERLQSILNQTYDNFEIIILDDKSSDNSKEVIESYRNHKKVSHIVYNEVNSGSPFVQWNKGISLAEGELVWIAESDDYADERLLEKLVNEFELYPETVLSYVSSLEVDDIGKILGTRYRPHPTKRLSGRDYIARYMCTGNHVKNASAALFRKEVAQAINPVYMTYKAGGDRLFWILIAEKGSVSVVNEQLNYFRRHGSTTTDRLTVNGVNHTESLKTYNYLKSNGYIGSFRDMIVKGYYWNSLKRWNFESEDIRNSLFDLWKVPKSRLSFPSIVSKANSFLQNKLNIFL